jgi:hypothetical protein
VRRRNEFSMRNLRSTAFGTGSSLSAAFDILDAVVAGVDGFDAAIGVGFEADSALPGL